MVPITWDKIDVKISPKHSFFSTSTKSVPINYMQGQSVVISSSWAKAEPNWILLVIDKCPCWNKWLAYCHSPKDLPSLSKIKNSCILHVFPVHLCANSRIFLSNVWWSTFSILASIFWNPAFYLWILLFIVGYTEQLSSGDRCNYATISRWWLQKYLNCLVTMAM